MKAAQAEPQNGMACAVGMAISRPCVRRYFQKACVLIGLERYEEALADLKKARWPQAEPCDSRSGA